jgi:hypothetical protein
MMKFGWFGLVRDAETGRVLFKYEFPDEGYADGIKLVVAWGKPVGTAFGTNVEIYFCGPTAWLLWYPVFDVKELAARIAEQHAAAHAQEGGGG